MTTRYVAILLLGGRGSRFGATTPKQFHQIKSAQEQFLFELTTFRLLSISPFSHVLFVIPKEINNQENSIFQKGLERIRLRHPDSDIEFTLGGDDRHKSFENAFLFLKAKKVKPSLLVVHDANRPFLSNDFLMRVDQEIKKMSDYRVCSIPTIFTVDSLIFEEQNSLHYLPREKVHHVQTPQLLWWTAVSVAFEKKKNDKSWTDEGSFLSDMGFKVNHYLGESTNQKITYEKDFFHV